MYYAELCKLHGAVEAGWMIDNGKVDEEEDSEGDTAYVKRAKIERDAYSHIKAACGARTST
eukprot:12380038-Karenia_brevis.AAC.1